MVMKFRDDHSGNPNTVVLQIADENRNVSKEDLGTRTLRGSTAPARGGPPQFPQVRSEMKSPSRL